MNANNRQPMRLPPSVITGCVHRTPSGGCARAASVFRGVAMVAVLSLTFRGALADDSQLPAAAGQAKHEGLFTWLLYPVTGKQPPQAAVAPAAKAASGGAQNATAKSASAIPPGFLVQTASGSAPNQVAGTLSQPGTWAPAAPTQPSANAPYRGAAVPLLQQPQYFAPGSGPIIATQYGSRRAEIPLAATKAPESAARQPDLNSSPSVPQPAQQVAVGQSSLWQMALGTTPGSSLTAPPRQVSESPRVSSTSGIGEIRSLTDQMIGRTSGAGVPSSVPASAMHAANRSRPQEQQNSPLTIALPSDASRAAMQHQAQGLWQQVAGRGDPNHSKAAAPPPSMASTAFAQGRVPLPSADSAAAAKSELQSSAAGLWRPLAARQNETAALVAGPPRNSATATSPDNRPSSERGPIADSKVGAFVLQPFYATNRSRTDVPNGAPYPSTDATLGTVGDLGSVVRSSSLVHQLTPASNKPVRRLPSIETIAPPQDARLAAYLQEVSPQPEDLNINAQGQPVLPPDPATTGEDTANTEGEGESDSLADAEKLGEEPEDNTLEFLRTETVLLKPGDTQCDVGLNYLLTETEFPILLADDMGDIVGVDEVNFRIRELTLPIEYRMGLHPRVQGFIGAPVGWSNTQLALDTFEAFQNDGGFGDIDFGLTIQLAEATANCPYVIANIAATAPTGGDPFSAAVGLAPTAPSLGQGFWSVNGSLLCIRPYDPIVFFYGIGTERFFEREFVGLEIRPGAQYTYNFGVGFAVNERVTLSTRFNGAYTEELEVNGERRFGTNAEPMTIRFSATISQPCDRLVEPFVEFGITDDAISSFIGVTWTFSHIQKEAKKSETSNGSQESKTPAGPSEE
jgi:hypothetical protein